MNMDEHDVGKSRTKNKYVEAQLRGGRGTRRGRE